MHALVEHDRGPDQVAVEEPLEIRVGGEPLAVTMRTPGDDEDLAVGFLFGEGLIDGPREAALPDDLAQNTIEVAGALLRDPASRSFFTSSSCGVCGKGALEEVAVHAAALPQDTPTIDRALLAALPDRLRQPGFERTGGLHATGLFTPQGELLVKKLREAGSRSSAPATSIVFCARSPGSVALRGPSMSPSPKRKPTARSSSWPGVRIVTASGSPSTRISSGSSTATASGPPSCSTRACMPRSRTADITPHATRVHCWACRWPTSWV